MPLRILAGGEINNGCVFKNLNLFIRKIGDVFINLKRKS
jgi:hypothetical protein